MQRAEKFDRRKFAKDGGILYEDKFRIEEFSKENKILHNKEICKGQIKFISYCAGLANGNEFALEIIHQRVELRKEEFGRGIF